MLPQFFLAGVFNPIRSSAAASRHPSHLAPMRYAVDLMRNVYYAMHPEKVDIPLASIGTNLAIIGGLFVLFIGIGTAFFVRAERNR